jgi:pullulanase/glycogen debranching enzyme
MLGRPLLSQGTPMMLADDEFSRIQQGSNDISCQHGETSWLD